MKCKCEYCTRRNLKKRLPTLAQLSKDWTMKQKYEHAGIKKIGYLDIEASGLTADFDIMLSWANLIRDVETNKTNINYDYLKKSDFELAYKKKNADLIDKRITESVIKEINKCDLLIGHWFIGKHRMDIPFIRTRVAINKIDGFPKHKQIRYGDTQKWASLLYRLHNNGLDSVANMFNISTKKTRLEPRVWKNACLGIKNALDYIVDHNKKDVIITYKVHLGIENFVPIGSIFC